MTLVSVEGLAKSYGRVVAVDDLSLKVEKGSVMGLIGPNGARKTTTIKMLLGLLKLDKGRVEVFGQDPWDNPTIRSRIGVVHEKAHFPSHQKAIDYLDITPKREDLPQNNNPVTTIQDMDLNIHKHSTYSWK